MLSIIITAWKDPTSTKECIQRFLDEKPKGFELWVTAPDKETKDVLNSFNQPNFHFFEQPESMGKNELFNILKNKVKGDILVFADGNKFIEKGALAHLLKPFEDERVGVTGGRPISLNSKNNMVGYWSHLLVDAGAHQTRLNSKGYVWLSANLLAVRRAALYDIPLDIAEDAVIPFLAFKNNWKTIYTPKARIQVTYPKNLKDWYTQKTRSLGAHYLAPKYIDNSQRSFSKEIRGAIKIFTYAENLKEVIWTFALFPARLYLWSKVIYNNKIKKQFYGGTWQRAKTTLPLEK